MQSTYNKQNVNTNYKENVYQHPNSSFIRNHESPPSYLIHYTAPFKYKFKCDVNKAHATCKLINTIILMKVECAYLIYQDPIKIQGFS